MRDKNEHKNGEYQLYADRGCLVAAEIMETSRP